MMPIYCYVHPESGERIERNVPISQFKRKIRKDGKTFLLDVGAQQVKPQSTSGWPKVSYAASVHGNQADELRDFCKSRGLVGTTVHNNGDVEFSSRAARKAHCQARGLKDFSGGYGDA